MVDIKFEIIQKIGVLSTSSKGWVKELNLISWNDREPKYDIREWSPDGQTIGKGVTLTKEELVALRDLLNSINLEGKSNMTLEAEFTAVLRETYDVARSHGYNPAYFMQMLEEHGGLGTARRLLAKSEPQEGLFTLWELGLLDISLEAVALQERFRPLFTEAEINEAHRRLDELKYFDK